MVGQPQLINLMRSKVSEKLIDSQEEIDKLLQQFADQYDSLLLLSDLSLTRQEDIDRLHHLRRRMRLCCEIADSQMSMMLRFLAEADKIKMRCKLLNQS
jgi:hypothetical protein